MSIPGTIIMIMPIQPGSEGSTTIVIIIIITLIIIPIPIGTITIPGTMVTVSTWDTTGGGLHFIQVSTGLIVPLVLDTPVGMIPFSMGG
jgi:hypothetical protein